MKQEKGGRGARYSCLQSEPQICFQLFFNALNDLKELEERFFQFAVLKFKQEVLFDPRSLNLNLHPERSRNVKAQKLWVCRLV